MGRNNDMRHVFIIGSKGIPAAYGGFETFTDRLIRECDKEKFTFHVACMDSVNKRVEYEGADCFHIKVPSIGPARAVLYDLQAFSWCLKQIEKEGYEAPIVYVLACRIGPFVERLAKKLHEFGGTLYVNPDGHEWMRAKWNKAIRKYWKWSERGMVKAADLLICDSRNMETYIQTTYQKYNPKTCYISYGADLTNRASAFAKPQGAFADWLAAHELTAGNYALIVGRFVPENNYETMIREYMASDVEMPLAIVTNFEQNQFYEELRVATDFEQDVRIRFVGTVYDDALLKEIRENAWAYLHGHEVGGTNPSLLEALGTTQVNLLLDVGFNREVGEDGALYWNKEVGNLAALLKKTKEMNEAQRIELEMKAKKRIRDCYSWKQIAESYTRVFAENAGVVQNR